MEYVVHHRFKKKAICGDVNIPAMEICEEVNGAIFYNNKLICSSKCKNAHQYFARNDDGQGMLRGNLTQAIQERLNEINNSNEYETIWKQIQNDSICQKYKRFKDEDTWLWNHEFFNANINDLQYIANLIGVKVK